MSARPPAALVRSLQVLAGFEWHDEVDSTNTAAAAAAARGVPEIHAVAADRQSAGRGRLDRAWSAPAGTSLLLSLVLRPGPGPAGTLPLLVGVALAEATEPFVRGRAPVALKWPNDLLVGGRKAAGILLEVVPGAVVAGIGVNVDWRGVQRPADLAGTTSLAEAAARDVDRWRVLVALCGIFARRYESWRRDPAGCVAAYRARCATLGARVRVSQVGGTPAVEGTACGITAAGALVVARGDGTRVPVHAGDVEHVRPPPS